MRRRFVFAGTWTLCCGCCVDHTLEIRGVDVRRGTLTTVRTEFAEELGHGFLSFAQRGSHSLDDLNLVF